MNAVINSPSFVAALEAVQAGIFDTSIAINLFTGPTVPTPSSVLGDFTLASFGGYADQVLTTMTGISEAADGTASFEWAMVAHFISTDAVTPQIATGLIIEDGAPVYRAAALLPTPVNFNRAGITANFVIGLTLGPAGLTLSVTQV
jgi:hypothetical protein